MPTTQIQPDIAIIAPPTKSIPPNIKQSITLQNFGGIIHEVRATGGGSRSDTLMKLKADILNQAVTTQRYKNAGILGLCMIEAISSGEYSSYAEAATNMIQTSKTFLPDRSYDQKFERYREIRTAISNLFQT